MLRYCRKNRNNIAAVVLWAINRFSRNQRDFLNVCEELRQIDIRLLSVTEKFDSETPEGRLQQSMVSMFAQFDNEKRSERTKIGMRMAMESGKWCHKPPLGFTTDPSVAGG
jgi:site-specific DNA recombinase